MFQPHVLYYSAFFRTHLLAELPTKHCCCLLSETVHQALGFTLNDSHVERVKREKGAQDGGTVELLYRKALAPPLALPVRLEVQQLVA